MRSRVVLAFLIAVGSCLAFAAFASACSITNLALPDSAGPGDTVSYSISGIEPNATYSFTIGGQTVSGTNDSSPGDGGTFTMPNLGSQELTLTAHGTCSCPGSAETQGLYDTMTYAPPPPAAPPASGPSQGSESAQPAVSATDSPKPKSAPTKHAPAASPSHSVAAPAAHGSGGGVELGTEVASPQARTASSDSAPRAQAAKTKERSGEASSSVPGRVLDTIGGKTSVGPANVPTLGLLAIALILIVGLGLAGVVIYFFRNGPDPNAAIKDPVPPGPDPIEDELQQIIADEMARQLVSHLNLGERTELSVK